MEKAAFEFNAPEYYDLNDENYDINYRNNADGYFNNKLGDTKRSVDKYSIKKQPLDRLKELRVSEPFCFEDPVDVKSEDITSNNEDISLNNEDISLNNEDISSKTNNDKDVNDPVKYNGNVSSKRCTVQSRLFNPTQSSLARNSKVETKVEKVKRDELRLTMPKSPKFNYRRKENASGYLSSTSMELQKVQEEISNLKKWKKKNENYRFKKVIKSEVVKRPLTVPESPKLATSRRATLLPTAASNQEEQYGYVKPENLMNRSENEYREEYHSSLTCAQSPQLATSLRAKLRDPVEEKVESWNKKMVQPCTKLTMGYSPQLATSTRAALASQHAPKYDEPNEDDIELKKKFHAKPVNRKIFDTKPERVETRFVPTVAQSPCLATKIRSRTSSKNHTPEKTPIRSYPKNNGGLTIAKTPKLKSLQLHAKYLNEFKRKQEMEQKVEKDMHNFKAKPILHPKKVYQIQPSSIPLTEVEPFSMPGDELHRYAMEKTKAIQHETMEKQKKDATITARKMPDMKKAFVPKPSSKPLTQVFSPKLASSAQAKRRLQFDLDDKSKRDAQNLTENALLLAKEQKAAAELKQLRKTQLRFRANPVKSQKHPYQVQPSEKELTVPQSPKFHK